MTDRESTPTTTTQVALSPAAAAKYVGLCRTTIYRLINQGHIRAFKIGRATRIPVSDLDALVGVCSDPAA